MKNPYLILLFISSVLIFSIILYGLVFIDPFLSHGYYVDDLSYYEMGEDIFQPSTAPFRYRILTPLLVYLLPFNTLTSFIIVNIAALYASIFLFYKYLDKLEFPNDIKYIGCIFFILNPITIFLLWAICFIDFLSFFLLLLSFHAIKENKRILFSISVSLGVLNREFMILLPIFYFLFYLKKKEFMKVLGSTLLVSIVPAICFGIVRLIYGLELSIITFYTLKIVFLVNIRNHQLNFFYHPYTFFLSFGILWIVFLVVLGKMNNDYLRRTLFFLPFVFVQGFLGTSYSRLFFYAFPVIIPISLTIYRNKIKPKFFIIILILAISLVFFHVISVYSLINSVMIFYLNVYNRLTPNSYFFCIILELLFDLYAVFALFYIYKKYYTRNSKLY